MADRYWVGGTGTWDATAGSKWSTTSGGGGGSAVPTSSDDVYFDAYTTYNQRITVGSAVNCADLNFVDGTGGEFEGEFLVSAAAGIISIYSNLEFSPKMILVHPTISGSLQFKSTSQGKTIKNNSQAFPGHWTFAGNGGGWTILDDVSLLGHSTPPILSVQGTSCSLEFLGNCTLDTTTSYMVISKGTVYFRSGTFSMGRLSISSDADINVFLNSATFNFNYSSSSSLTIGDLANFDAGTSTMNINQTSPTISAHNRTLYDVNILGGVGWLTIEENMDFNSLNFTPTTTKSLITTVGARIRIFKDCTYNGVGWRGIRPRGSPLPWNT